MKKLRKRDKYVIAAVLNLCWYCIAVLVLTAHDKVGSAGQPDGGMVRRVDGGTGVAGGNQN